ncbi:hypothetical protein SELMODRAFT_231207 [Selaginella moellendorffii]|uniref:Laccase n=1 Tax=Selaginella moellendorffii TaxID=88036 RepID=D8RC89_SELML|nr:laccase-11 [Selaginella moellendorffii]XP_024529574.1 laccase-11 [Selaginella moellendorffii]XP_024529575.1 laccase-11 [Selaginella moellendorffii]EFJ29811.1 hypothetical protein SELMODRAFT_231207 [Selaginella moellendorffii]|eukprot:XP_002968695.1 laccase-11 [Selaginella moellendorffii]
MELVRSSGTRFLLLCVILFFRQAAGRTRKFEFNVAYMSVNKLCRATRIVAVNGQFPGPSIRIQQGDKVIVRVHNMIRSNITIHWHGVQQRLSCWQDGPAFITQCPIQERNSFTYRFRVDQVGTLFWHAHAAWLRGTVHGAFIIEPVTRRPRPYPFPQPFRDETIILGDWFVNDLLEEEERAIVSGGAPDMSNAFIINGKPGPLFNCSATSYSKSFTHEENTHKIGFIPGEAYLLRIINAALEQDLFFSIANHTMTVVEIDASYTKHLTVTEFLITPGQTVSVLVKASQHGGSYYMAASPWRSGGALFQPTAALGIIEYITPHGNFSLMPVLHNLPNPDDKALGQKFQKLLRSLNSKQYPEQVPQFADRRLFHVVSLNVKPCSPGINCSGPAGLRLSSSINNVSFVSPKTSSILEAYYNRIPGVFTADFPDKPPAPYDYVGKAFDISDLFSETGTRVSVIPYGANVQLVLQTTINLANDSHPFHLHGFDFYIVGEGHGNFDGARDERKFNLVDPPRRNTALIPIKGWIALRFKADNPGTWLFHCHLDGHLTWGLEMAFIVLNGEGPKQTLPSPPKHRPKC